ncbi:hypothetical protein FM113_15780 [Leucobacter sp. 7(1)]|nr:hypothetical protein FM113_15780 [Leucobacter sp. 7(1)]
MVSRRCRGSGRVGGWGCGVRRRRNGGLGGRLRGRGCRGHCRRCVCGGLICGGLKRRRRGRLRRLGTGEVRVGHEE